MAILNRFSAILLYCDSTQSLASLVAPYCAILRDYLSDTPLLRAMGLLVSQHCQLGAIPPSPFSEHFPLGEHAKWSCDTPPKRGISTILARYPMKTRQMGATPPLCDTISKGYCAIGGVSRTGPLSWLLTSIGISSDAGPRVSESCDSRFCATKMGHRWIP